MTRSPGRLVPPRVLRELVPVLLLMVAGLMSASPAISRLPLVPDAAAGDRTMHGGVPTERSFRLPASATTSAPFEYQLLVLLVEFRDVRASTGDDRVTPEQVYDRLFGETNGRLAAYWHDASGGRLSLRGTVTNWVRVDSTYAYYASDGDGNSGSGVDPFAYPHNAPRLVEEAIAKLGGSYRFSDFDNNRDGLIDGLLVLHAGEGLEEAAGSPPPDPRLVFLAHQFHTRTELAVTGSVVFDYAFAAVGAGHGVAAHEFGHLLGLIDLYDTGFFAGRNGPFGVGDWSLMGTGALVGDGDSPTGLDADSRIRLGFVQPETVSVGSTEIDWGVERGADAVVRLAAGPDPREYFLLEPRWQEGIDVGLPAEGFLIWHVDERQPANRGPDSYRVALVQPDGRNDLGRLNGNRGDAGDAWPTTTGTARDRFNDTTTPSARTNAGEPTAVSIRGMSRSSDWLYATYDIAPELSIGLAAMEVHELPGDGDGRVEAGEAATIDITLCNGGELSTGPLMLTMVIDPSSSADVTAGAPVTMDPILSRGCGQPTQPLTLTVHAGIVEPTAVAAILLVTDVDRGVIATIDLLVPLLPGAAVTLTAAPGEPSWRAVSLNPEREAPWSVATDRYRTAPAAWRLGSGAGTTYDTRLDAAWLSPTFVVPTEHSQLTLWSAMDAETLATGRAFDGGRIEMQSGLGAWEVLAPAGGWPFELEVGSGNSLAGEEVHAGHDINFQRLVFDLSNHAGQAARIRYRFASDDVTASGQGQSGWWLDDVAIASTGTPPDLMVVADADSATVTWTTAGPEPIHWRVYRRADVRRAARQVIEESIVTNASNEFRASLVDHPPMGRWIYSIRPITSEGPGLEFDASAVQTVESTESPTLDLYPNPYRLDGPPLNIEYLLPGSVDDRYPVKVRLFDVTGRLVETIVEETAVGGLNCRRWPSSSLVRQPAPGVYFARLDIAGQQSVHERLVISR